jgi:hypothetical protein
LQFNLCKNRFVYTYNSLMHRKFEVR